MTHTTKHTPGPLKAVQVIIENSPCTWAVQRKSIREQWGKPSIATYIDNEADARLFAAAPAMYEALKDLLGELGDLHDGSISELQCHWCGRCYDDLPSGSLCPSDDCPGYKARAALTQAEGAQHE